MGPTLVAYALVTPYVMASTGLDNAGAAAVTRKEEAHLREHVDAIREGRPLYAQMGPQLAADIKGQLPALQDALRALGPVRAVLFSTATENGHGFLVQHDQVVRWDMRLMPDGRVMGLWYWTSGSPKVMELESRATPPMPRVPPDSVARTPDGAKWGDYVHLAGRKWRSWYDVDVRWKVVGRELEEIWTFGAEQLGRSGRFYRKVSVRLDAQTGQLSAQVTGDGSLTGEFVGKISGDGRVTFQKGGSLLASGSTPFGVDLLQPGLARFSGYTVTDVSNYAGMDAYVATREEEPPRRAEWGVLLDAVGKHLSYRHAGRNLLVNHGWLVPGEVMYARTDDIDRHLRWSEHYRLTPENALTARASVGQPRTGDGRVLADGSVAFKARGISGFGQEWGVRPGSDGTVSVHYDSVLESESDVAGESLSENEARQMRAASAKAEQLREQEKAAASAARWETLNSTMVSAHRVLQDVALENERRRTEDRAQRAQPSVIADSVDTSPTQPVAQPAANPRSESPRPRVGADPKPTPVVPATPSSNAASSSCKIVTKRFVDRSLPMSTRAKAEAFLRFNQCKFGSGTRESLSCSTDDEPVMQKDKDGILRITGRHTVHVCEMSYTCQIEVCESGSAGGSKQ